MYALTATAARPRPRRLNEAMCTATNHHTTLASKQLSINDKILDDSIDSHVAASAV